MLYKAFADANVAYNPLFDARAHVFVGEQHQMCIRDSPHSIASDYAPVGLDATLVYGTMDLRIKNASEDPMRIKAMAVGQTVEVSIIGQPLETGTTIDATSKVVDQYVDDDGDLHYVAESYRVYYLCLLYTSVMRDHDDEAVVRDLGEQVLSLIHI